MTAKPIPVQIDAIICKGGLDQVTPTLSLAAGAARQALNFECAVTGGYARIKGYERFDGRPSPADMAEGGTHRFITMVAYSAIPETGAPLLANNGASGVVAWRDGLTLAITKINESSGTWDAATTVVSGILQVGTIATTFYVPDSFAIEAQVRSAVADIYRADIGYVPGSGPIRGVVALNDTVYAFRDHAPPTHGLIYKSTPAGWTEVPLYLTIGFRAGHAATPADGDTLTQGGVTATIKRIVRTGGSWDATSPTAQSAGRFIIETPAGGSFIDGPAMIGELCHVYLTDLAANVQLTAGGWYEFAVTNFFGQSDTTRIYGVNGTGPAFEFDGDVLAPILTGMTNDTPDHIAAHNGYLMLGNKSSLLYSTPGEPYNWSSGQAGEIAVGGDITGFISMPGGTNQATLGILTRDTTYILYGPTVSGTDILWNLVPYNTGTGAAPRTLQNMAQTFVCDDRGVNSIQATLTYGNFAQSSLTSAILPFFTEHVGKATASTLCRKKSQYRLFFNNGFGLFITVVNNKLLGCMPVYFPDTVTCCYEGKDASGQDVIYFGTDNGGLVYQMEKGTSFDGAAIQYYLALNASYAKQPRTLKRYRKIAPEVLAEGNAFAMFNLAYVLGYGSPEYAQDVEYPYSQALSGFRWDTAGLSWDRYQWDVSMLSPIESYADGTAENIAIVINGSSDYVDAFTLNSFLVHYTPRRLMR